MFYLKIVIKYTEDPSAGTIIFVNNGKEITNEANKIVLTKDKEIYIKLSGASDSTNNITYYYKVLDLTNNVIISDYNVNKLTPDQIGKMLLVEGIGNTGKVQRIQINYQVLDGAGNRKEVTGTVIFEIDTVAPKITIKEAQSNTEVASGSIYRGEENLKVEISDELQVMQIIEERNNREIRNVEATNTSIDIKGFGHYKYIVIDKAGNKTEVEIMVLGKDNTYTVIDKDGLNEIETASKQTNVEYDRVILQEINDTYTHLNYNDENVINDSNKLYFMGVVPNYGQEEGAIFSILRDGVNGRVFKEESNSFRINASTNISNIAQGYTIEDYLINYNGKKYILICIDDDGARYEDNDNQDQTNENKNKGNEGSNMSWVLYGLGTIGVLGGGYVILKLRKRVRAA